jgi:ubiquinone biosynthesis protein Coq4
MALRLIAFVIDLFWICVLSNEIAAFNLKKKNTVFNILQLIAHTWEKGTLTKPKMQINCK